MWNPFVLNSCSDGYEFMGKTVFLLSMYPSVPESDFHPPSLFKNVKTPPHLLLKQWSVNVFPLATFFPLLPILWMPVTFRVHFLCIFSEKKTIFRHIASRQARIFYTVGASNLYLEVSYLLVHDSLTKVNNFKHSYLSTSRIFLIPYAFAKRLRHSVRTANILPDFPLMLFQKVRRCKY